MVKSVSASACEVRSDGRDAAREGRRKGAGPKIKTEIKDHLETHQKEYQQATAWRKENGVGVWRRRSKREVLDQVKYRRLCNCTANASGAGGKLDQITRRTPLYQRHLPSVRGSPL